MKSFLSVVPRGLDARVRGGLSMLAAGLAAISTLTDAVPLLGSTDANQVEIAAVDNAYGQLRTMHELPARVAFLQLPGPPDLQTARHYLAQYGMAPAVVTPVSLGECFVPMRVCPLGGADRVVTDNASRELLALLTNRFGYRVAAQAGAVALLERAK